MQFLEKKCIFYITFCGLVAKRGGDKNDSRIKNKELPID